MKKRLAAAVLLIVALSGCAAPAATPSGAAGSVTTTQGAAPTATANVSASAGTGASTAATPVGDWYTATFHTFTPITKTGTSDALIDLPPGAVTGIITASYTGTGNFILQGLDAKNQETPEAPVNAVGNYTGVTSYGYDLFGSPTASFQVTGTGKWTISIAPVNTVTALPAAGTGDDVYRYDGPAKSWTVTNKGSSVFQIEQYAKDSSTSGFNLTQTGDYSGTVQGLAGPSLIVIQGAGAWTVK